MKSYCPIKEPSERIKTLKNYFDADYRNRDKKEHAAAYRSAYREFEHLSFRSQQARGLARFLKTREVVLREYDLFAGNGQHYDGWVSMPILQEETDPYFGGKGDFDIPKECEYYLQLNGRKPEEEELLKEFLVALESGLVGRWGSGHVICGYRKVVMVGLEAIIREAKGAAELMSDPRKKENIDNMILVLEAAQIYIRRNAEKARELAEQTSNAQYKKTLMRIADACDHVSSGKARDFYEALQLFLLTQDVIFCESISGSLSVGRIDQWLNPYYQQDLEKGRITQEEAQEMLDAAWLKLNMAMNTFQNVTLGGVDAFGRFAGNEVSLMCMRASLHIGMAQPLLSFRWNKDMPEIFWEETLALIRSGMGFPALFNDAAVFESKMNAGVSPEDVWNYGIVGCVETSIEEEEYSNTEEFRLSWPKILELMMFGGECAYTGKKIRMAETHKLDEFQCFEDFYNWYKREMVHFLSFGIKCTDMLESSYGEFWPAPFLSATMKNAFRTGLDITQGNAKYSFSSINGMGMADTIDSLYAIKEVVFERKLLSLSEFAEILKKNYEGEELLCKMVQNLPERYGTDSDITNTMLQDLSDLFLQTICSARNWLGNRYQAGLYSVDSHAKMGKKTAALPSGRKAGVSLANALSPCQGVDTVGPTATANTALNADTRYVGNGLVLDMKFLPQFLMKKGHQEGLRNLITSYFEKGGMEIQFNVVDRQTLLNAQKHPENYKHLLVRVSGYSANFVYLDTTLQNEIIARTEFGGTV